MKLKNLFVLALACSLIVSSLMAGSKRVGISMPTKSSARWIADGKNLVLGLEKVGYKTNLQYAEDDIPNQLSQIENMITKGVDILVVASIDGSALSNVLEQAYHSGIKVIAYDRLIKNSPYVDYYVTFDNFGVGILQAKYIEKSLGLKKGKGPFNIELFGGSPDDNNAYFFYNGAMSILDSYIKNKQLVVQSGQFGMNKVSTLRWDGAVAQARMDNILSAYYSKKRVDAVLSPYDGISIGIISSLRGVGYGTKNLPLPIVTGQDAEISSVKSILANEQSSTVFKDTRALAEITIKMIDALLNGKKVPINDTKTYYNGNKIVPAYLLKPIIIDKSNWEEVLINSGYYKKNQFK